MWLPTALIAKVWDGEKVLLFIRKVFGQKVFNVENKLFADFSPLRIERKALFLKNIKQKTSMLLNYVKMHQL